MNKILCLLLSISLTLPIFGQDGEEIDFLDKVSEPKKTTTSSKKAPLAKASRKKKVKKNAGKKKKQLESKELEQKEGEPKKKVEPEIAPDDPTQGKNSGDPNGPGETTEKPANREIANQETSGEIQKPYWLNEETNISPKSLPGYDASAASLPKEDISIREKLGEILKLGDDKRKEEEKRKAAEQKEQGAIAGFFSEHKKGIIIIAIILAFALYQFRAKGARVTRRSPVTINKVRRD
ncbi:SRP-less Sec system protein [Leptospira sarikeiensis]|uniref:Sec region non-globular protein n=1 Tax=Leptospira sarikeiensis TaxID=2484943 RepID=A0A4V3JRU0_9LEPT|nr:SRP-less Sec system protein [Leptospira sarikeiensis]TGL61721.1 Sec region non-globular protein [Leptospira sarikeiensis]